MTNQSKQRVEEALNEMLTDARCAAIEDCVAVIWKQYEQYKKLINNTEAERIWYNSNGDRFNAIEKKQRSLIRKMGILSKILGKLYDLKLEEQEEK